MPPCLSVALGCDLSGLSLGGRLLIGFRKFMVRQRIGFRIINSVGIKRTAFRISAADLAIHVSFGNYTPAEQAMAEIFSHLGNLLVFL